MRRIVSKNNMGLWVCPVLLLGLVLSTGCAKRVSPMAKGVSAMGGMVSDAMAMRSEAAPNPPREIRSDRMLIWRADLALEVLRVQDALTQSIAIAEKSGGYVQTKTENGEESAQITLRIPAKALKSTIGTLEKLGKVTRRSVTGEDVTEQYIDLDARLKNAKALRDRLTQLLGKAKDVKDIIAIEAELNRIQTEIDSSEGRIKSLKSQADFATIELSLHRQRILGPLGYVFNGVVWTVRKLFVLRD